MSRGKHKVLKGIDYRSGDGWRRAEPGDVVEDLDDLTDADYRALRDPKLDGGPAIEPVKPRRAPAKASPRRNS